MKKYSLLLSVVYWLFCICPISGNTLVNPTPSAGTTAEGTWRIETAVSYGLQKILPQAQNSQAQFGIETALHLGENTLIVSTSALDSKAWGFIGLRMHILSQEFHGVDLTGEIRSTIPSWSMTVNPWVGVTCGQNHDIWSWSFGSQFGLLLSPMPNQRPLGPKLFINGYASLTYALFQNFYMAIDATFAGDTGSLIPGIIIDIDPFKISLGIPLNWIIYNGHASLQPLPPGLVISYRFGGTL
jgi:hypothetical protein